jgi:hypothetical protein
MKAKKATALIFSIIIFSSCTTGWHTVRTTDINGGVISTPVLADLNVTGPKVTGMADYSGATNSVGYVKGLAVADALKNSNADVLVEPSFDIKITPELFVADIKVTVTGYPATYKNFRSATAADSTIIKMSLTSSSPSSIQQSENSAPPKKHKGIIIAALAAGVVIILAIAGAF